MPSDLRLQDIQDWSTPALCVPRAFAAVTGKTPTEMATLICNVAGLPDSGPAVSFATKDWFPALSAIGAKGTLVDLLELNPSLPLPSLQDYIRAPHLASLHFAVAVYATNTSHDTHVVALEGEYVVDEYTNGKPAARSTATVPPLFSTYEVRYVIQL